MINKLLHALSNRKEFNEPYFKPAIQFTPAYFPQVENECRRLLYLDVSNTDYYLKLYLGLLHAYPDIEANFDDRVRTYSVEDFGIQVIRIEDGDFVSDSQNFGYFTDPPATLPVQLRYQLQYFQPDYTKVSIRENGQVFVVRHSLSSDKKVLHLNWPDNLPFQGPLKVRSPWTEGSSIVIDVEPRGFPYETMARRLDGNLYLIRLFSEASLVDEYVNTKDHQRKVALALAVLAAHNPAVYG